MRRQIRGCANLCAVVAITAVPLLGQTTKPISQVISISPISLVFGVIGAEYERALGPTQSFGVSGTFYRPELFSYLSGEVKYRYYPQEKALEGFSVGVTGGLTQIGTHGTESSNESGTAASVGFALDYQWLLGPKKHFAVTLGTGARRLIPFGTKVDGSSLTLPTARISIGRGF
jgi:Protein of unknown function (DUF3575)